MIAPAKHPLFVKNDFVACYAMLLSTLADINIIIIRSLDIKTNNH